MKVLHLNLEKKWFDMILSGQKKEEYRKMKPYWQCRLLKNPFDAICFKNGYRKNALEFTIKLTKIYSGLGIVEWGAPEKEPVYILRLGRILA
jgi:ASC-1-like (ASCH) protein